MPEKAKHTQKAENRPVKQGQKNNSSGKASGVPNSSGGSRQGNIGHQSNDDSNKGHR
jgi:hypothetical protein